MWETGHCEVCHEDFAIIKFCGLCDAWICAVCRREFRDRAKAMWERLTEGKRECCAKASAHGTLPGLRGL